ncbi:MAG: Holliday junction resolvase RecU [bacterium]|nr:Holliday junction resolvase RecU [bacterium]
MKYPTGIKINIQNKNTEYGNRGMNLEDDINLSNQYYIDNKIAYIYKKPTPIKIIKVDYPSRSKAVIKEAYFKEPSTTDYNGLYKGHYIDFEAKETNNTSFPLANIHKHQVEHIKNIYENGGICFLVVQFNKYNKIFLLDSKDFLFFISHNSRKSIPYDFFIEHGHIIERKYLPRLDYIKIIDKLLEVQK